MVLAVLLILLAVVLAARGARPVGAGALPAIGAMAGSVLVLSHAPVVLAGGLAIG
jgi:hypothetical protein